jgi:autotransporter-associated beta strand protein
LRIVPEIALRCSATLLAIFALFGFNPQALANTDTWIGNTSANWADANWSTSPATSGDTLLFGAAGTAGSTLSDNLMTPGTYTINGITFTSSAATYTINPGTPGTSGFTLSSTGVISNASANTETINDLIALTGTDTFSNTNGGGLTFGGIISGALDGVLVTGGGTVTFNGSTANTYTGGTTVNWGTLNLNFANLSTPTNLISSSSPLLLGGGTLEVTGKASATTSQTFASTTFVSGLSTIEAVAGAGGSASIVLGTLTHDTGSDVVFDLPSSGTIGTGVAQTAGLLGASGADYGVVSGSGNTTVTDFAGVSATGQIQSGKSLGIANEYTTNTAAGNPVANDPVVEYDVNATGNQNIGNNAGLANLLFDTHTTDASGWNFVGGSGKTWNINEILVTSAVGDNNVTFAGGTVSVRDNTGGSSFVLDQYNTGGEMIFNTGISLNNSSATTNLTQSGPGTVVFNTTNGYTGVDYLNGGTTEISGTEALGATATANINMNGGSVLGNYTGSLDGGSSATAHPIVLGNTGGGLAATAGNTFTVDGLISGAGQLVIGNANTGGLVAGTGSGTPNAAVDATGTVIISDASNSYSGGTVIESGTLEMTGVSGDLGAGGVTLNGGTFEWGSGNTADISTHTLTLGSNGGVINTNGNSPVLAGATGFTGSGGFTKTGAGTLTFDGANTYTGATTITTGTLALGTGGSLGNTTVSVGAGTTLLTGSGNGGISGNVSLASTSNLALRSTTALPDTTTNTLTIGGTLTFTGATDNLDLDLLGGTGMDQITVNGGALLGTGNGVVNINNLGGTAPANLTTYYFLIDSGGFGSDTFSLGTTAITIGTQAYDLSLVSGGSGTEEGVLLTFASLNYYWDGNASSSWSNVTGNFAKATNGSQQQTSGLSSTSNVFLTDTSPTGGTYTQTLDGSYTINSLSFTGAGTGAGSNSVTLGAGSGGTLTIDGLNTFTDNAGNSYSSVGLVVQPGAAADTINANIDLGASQTWDIYNTTSTPLTVNGTIADGTTLDALTLTSTTSGEVVLGAANTYDGGTTVTGNVTVKTSIANALSSSGSLTVSGTGTLDLSGDNETITGLSDGGSSSGVITSSTGAATLTINNTTPSSFGGTLTDANNGSNGVSLALSLVGNSTVTLSASNSYTGGTTVSGGTLTTSNNYALGSPTSSIGGLTMDPSTGTATVNFTSSNPNIAALASSGAGTSDVVLGNGGAHTATTLTVGGGTATTVFGGIISDANTALGAIGNLTVVGGQLTLSGTDTFTGTTIVSGGTLVLGNPLALEDSTLNYNGQGGTFSFGTQTAATLAELTGAQNLALENVSSGGVTLTVGNGVADNYTGSLGGNGSLDKVGSDTLTLSNANYSGATTVALGALDITGGTVGSSTSAFNVQGNSGTVQTATATISSGDLLASTVDIGIGANQFNAILTISGNADATFSTGAVIGAAGDTGGGIDITSSGSVSLGAVSVARDNGTGLTVAGGTVTASSVDVQATGNSSVANAHLNISSGSLTITAASGGLKIGDVNGSDTSNNGHTGSLNMTGGTLTYLGSDGLLAVATAPGSGITTGGNISITGGIATLTGITLNAADSTTAQSELTVGNGATLYLGSVGLVENTPVGLTQLVTATFDTATVGAIADWSSSGAIALTSGSTTTFQAADSLGNAYNIALSGAITGSGGALTKTGGGSLTLSNAADSYTGATTVNAGALIVSGGLTGSVATVNAGGTLEVDGSVTDSPVLSGGTLQGTGTVPTFTTTSGDNSTVAPGLTVGSTSPGQLTASGNATLQAGDTFSIRVGVAAATDSDSLSIGANTLTLNGATLAVNTGAFAGGATTDQLYDIVVGTGAGNTVGTFDFGGNPLANGAEFTTNTNYTYQIFYNVLGTDPTQVGSDDVLELVSIPEPGTWASLLGGLGMLIVWQRSRRRRA